MSDELDFQGARVRLKGDALNLTDMWRAAGAPENKPPAIWQRQNQASEFILHHRVQTTGFQPVSFSFTMGVEGVADEGGYWGGVLGEGLFAAAGR